MASQSELANRAGDRSLKGRTATTITSSTTEQIIVAAIASTYNDIYKLIITNTSATTCAVSIRDDVGGTVRYVISVPAGDTRGFTCDTSSAAFATAVNKNWTATCGTSVASIIITAEYIKNT